MTDIASAAPRTPAAAPPRTVWCHDTRADARRNHQSLLEAATAAFAARGPEVSLEEVARSAGLGIGTLYRHFPTREALMAAVVRDAFESLRDRAAQGLSAADPWAAVEDWVRAYLAFAATKRGLVAGIMLLKDGDDEWAPLCDRMFGAVDSLVARAQVAGVLRDGVSGRDLMHLSGAIAASAERADDPTMPDRLLAIALAGLRVEPAPPRPVGNVRTRVGRARAGGDPPAGSRR